MKTTIPFHPPLAAVYVPLSLYASNVALIPMRDVAVPTLLCLAGGLALWGLLGILLRNAARSAAAATAIVAAFFTYGPLDDWARKNQVANREPWEHVFPLWLWLLAALILATAAGWKWKSSRGLTTFLNFFSAALCAMAAGSAVWAQVAIGREIARHAGNPSAKLHREGGLRPDIFYIILDGYGRTDTFERLYDFSDGDFVEWLEGQGFYVAHRAHSNYVQTELSLASSLNSAPISDLVKPMGSPPQERLLLDRLISDSAAARRLREIGYRTMAVTSGFPALTFEGADVVVGGETGASLYSQALMQKTPIRFSRAQISSLFDQRRQLLDRAFDALERFSAPSAAPKFVIAHILAPHPPFVFGPNGEPRRPSRGPFGYWDGSHFREVIGSVDEYRANYRDQAIYIAKRVQAAVERILADSKGQAIILIQGDHGPKSALDQNSRAKTDLAEAFSILSAYHVPEPIRSELDEGITPVNSFGPILNALSDAKIERRPDRSYYSTWEEPLKLEDVTDELR